MAHPKTAAKADPYVHISGLGRLWLAPQADAPLLMVFGGIDVGGQHSGIYMWNYMARLKDRYNIFVALSNLTPGTSAYRAVMKELKSRDITPSDQILYLFSGGYLPGMQLLKIPGTETFSRIFLVDIWMRDATVATSYRLVVNNNSSKFTYVYTEHGAVNDSTRDYIADKVGTRATLVQGRAGEAGMHVHMRTNEEAVSNL